MAKTYKLDLNIGEEIRLTVNAPDPLDPRYRQVIDTMIAAMESPADPAPPASTTIIQREPWLREELHLIAGATGTGDMAVSAYRAAFPGSQRTDKAIRVKHAILHPGRNLKRGIVRKKRPPLNNTDWIVPSDAHINNRMQWSEEEDNVLRHAGCVSHARTNYRIAFPNSKRTDKGISIRYDRLATLSAPPTVSIMETDEPVPQEPLSTGMEVTLHDPIPEPAPIPPAPEKKVRKDAWTLEEDSIVRSTSTPEQAVSTYLSIFGNKRPPGAIQARWRNTHSSGTQEAAPPADPIHEPEAAPVNVTHDPADLPDTLLRHLLVSISSQDAIDRYRQQYRGPKPYSDTDIRTLYKKLSMPIRIGIGVETRAGVGKITRINRDGTPTVIIDCKKKGKIVLDPVSIYRENRIVRSQLPSPIEEPANNALSGRGVSVSSL